MKQSDLILDAQREEIHKLMANNIGQGISLLHNELKNKMDALKQQNSSDLKASLKSHKDQSKRIQKQQARLINDGQQKNNDKFQKALSAIEATL